MNDQIKKKSSMVNKILPPKLENDNIIHYYGKYVSLVEDTYGMLLDEQDQPILVKRFTWTNHNKISVSVITYGARIVSMKIPDRYANVDEIVLGFDDLAGYIFYDKFGFGATNGRTTTKIFKSTYVVNGKQNWLTANDKEHHVKGGVRGFDKVNWTPYIDGKVLQLSYLSPDGDEGYPGDLHVRMLFELTTSAEFHITITANTTKVTPIDVTNNTYVNLAGHNAGMAEIKKHELLINANCHTPMDDTNDFPTGEIMNVVHTRNNFQVPKLLEEVMGDGSDGAYDQNFCVNRGVQQENAFVARLVHPFKGRVMEIYSNQYGVNFNNAWDFPDGQFNIPSEILNYLPQTIDDSVILNNEAVFIIIKKLTEYFRSSMNMQHEEYITFVRRLAKKLLAATNDNASTSSASNVSSEIDFMGPSVPMMGGQTADFTLAMFLKPLEAQFLIAIKELLPYVTDDMPFELVKDAIDEILKNQVEIVSTGSSESCSFIRNIISKQIRSITNQASIDNVQEQEDVLPVPNSIFRRLQEEKHERNKKLTRTATSTPSFYKKERIIGRGGVVYKRYGGISLRTQCYPNALQCEKFPKPILRPNETYRHSIIYKFWVLSGNPAKWLRRLEVSPCVDVSDLSEISNSTDC